MSPLASRLSISQDMERRATRGMLAAVGTGLKVLVETAETAGQLLTPVSAALAVRLIIQTPTQAPPAMLAMLAPQAQPSAGPSPADRQVMGATQGARGTKAMPVAAGKTVSVRPIFSMAVVAGPVTGSRGTQVALVVLMALRGQGVTAAAPWAGRVGFPPLATVAQARAVAAATVELLKAPTKEAAVAAVVEKVVLGTSLRVIRAIQAPQPIRRLLTLFPLT